MDYLRKRKIVLTLLAVIVFLSVIALLLWIRGAQGEPIQINPLSNIPGSQKYTTIKAKDDKLIFSNGRFLVEYGPNNQVKRISDTTEMPEVIDLKISPSGRYVAFRTDAAALEIPKFKELNANPITGTAFWWVTDTKSGKISSLFTDNSYLVEWSGPSTIIYAVSDTLTEYSVDTNKYRELQPFGKNITDFLPYSERIVALTDDGLVKSYDKKGGDSRLLYQPATKVVFGEKAGCFLAFDDEESSESSSSKLVGCGQNEVELDEEFVYVPNFADEDRYLIYFDGKDYEYIDTKKGERGQIVSSGRELASFRLVDAESLDALVFADESSYYFSGGGNFGYGAISSNRSFPVGDVIVDLYSKDQTIVLSKTGEYTERDRSLVLSKVKEEGYNPDIYTVVFKVLLPDEYRW